MNNRNIFRCPECGFTVLAETFSRVCSKCETPMELIGIEQKKDKKKYER